MVVKQDVKANSGTNTGLTNFGENRRKFLTTLTLAGAALTFSKFGSIPLLAQEAKNIVKVKNATIKPSGNFSIEGGAESVVGEKILDAVTNKGKWEISEAYLVNSDVYVLRFKYGVVMISDKNGATAFKAYPNEIVKFDVLEPGKGEAARVNVGSEILVGKLVGNGMDKEMRLETKAA